MIPYQRKGNRIRFKIMSIFLSRKGVAENVKRTEYRTLVRTQHNVLQLGAKLLQILDASETGE